MKEVQDLIKWSKRSYSHLPWREKRSLYHTLVSEIMLQQTTVSTVLNHFERFIEAYPTVTELAKTSEDEICIAWKGLGYYRRARNLRKAAIDIESKFEGKIPLNYDDLISITGIGEYTANAILSIGKDQQGLAVDANLERVISRLFGIQHSKGLKLQKKIKDMFNQGDLSFGKVKSYRELNESLMDLGRVLCRARNTDCAICPLRKKCLAQISGDPLAYPEKPVNKVKKYFELELLRAVVIRGNKVLGYEKNEDEWLSGQIEIPTFIIRSEDGSFNGYDKWKGSYKSTLSIKTSITKYKITNYVITPKKSDLPKSTRYKYYDLDLKNVNFSTTSLKILNKLDVT